MTDLRDRFYPSRDPRAGLQEDHDHFLRHARITLGMPMLFYASLRHPRVFETVVGRPMEDTQWERVTVPGYSTYEVRAGTGYPAIFAAESATALDCLLISDLTPFERTMIAWYEWDEYALQEMPLTDGRSAEAFIPDLDAIRREYGAFDIVPWSFENWRASSLEESVANARDWIERRPDNQSLEEAGFLAKLEAPINREAIE